MGTPCSENFLEIVVYLNWDPLSGRKKSFMFVMGDFIAMNMGKRSSSSSSSSQLGTSIDVVATGGSCVLGTTSLKMVIGSLVP